MQTAKPKQIPKMLSTPIVQSKVTNTVNVYGKKMQGDSPVVVGVMVAKCRREMASVGKIRTVHAKRYSASQITGESVLYLNPNKKETIARFQARDNDVPLGGKRFGFIRSVAEKNGNVKSRFSMKDTEEEKNAYGKDNRLDVLIQNSEILDLDPNKNSF